MHAFESERVSQDEANRVVELWAQRQRERDLLNEMPTIAGLAEALGTSQGEVAALLHQVREPKQSPKVRPDRALLLSGAITFGVCLLVVAGILVNENFSLRRSLDQMNNIHRAQFSRSIPPPLPGQPVPTVWVEAPPAPPETAPIEG